MATFEACPVAQSGSTDFSATDGSAIPGGGAALCSDEEGGARIPARRLSSPSAWRTGPVRFE
jgi:hypothetical protein